MQTEGKKGVMVSELKRQPQPHNFLDAIIPHKVVVPVTQR